MRPMSDQMSDVLKRLDDLERDSTLTMERLMDLHKYAKSIALAFNSSMTVLSRELNIPGRIRPANHIHDGVDDAE